MSILVNDDDNKVFIATAISGEVKVGFVITWVSEASLNRKKPKIIMVVSKFNQSLPIMEKSRKVLLNLLSYSQIREFCVFGLKSSREINKYESFEFETTSYGIKLNNSAGYIACTIDNIFETPDRKILYCTVRMEEETQLPIMILSEVLANLDKETLKSLSHKFEEDSLRDEVQFPS